MASANQTTNSNHLLLGLTVYTLTVFVYRDFNIPMAVGYALFSLLVLYTALSKGACFSFNKLVWAFAVLMILQALEILRSYVGYNKTHQLMYIPAFLLFICCVLVANTSEREIELAYRIWLITAIIIALYVGIAAISPNTVLGIGKRILSQESIQMNENLLMKGYGIAIGGNIIISEYIMAFALLYFYCCLLIVKTADFKQKTLYCALFLALFIAMILENRKSELIGVIAAGIIMTLSRFNYSSVLQRRRRVLILAGGCLALLIVLAGLYSTGHLGRYGEFVDALLLNRKKNTGIDISSGRLTLWGIAWGLFLKHPVMGIGWGNFAAYIPFSLRVSQINEINNVHNCYLQLLCETGIIGFLVFVSCIVYITYLLVKNAKLVKQFGRAKDRVLLSACIGYHFFFLIVAAIDPVFYSLVFWSFYTASLVIAYEVIRKTLGRQSIL